MANGDEIRSYILGVVGAILGGTLGYFVFFWAARQGFYALALPGALLGIGAGILSGRKSTPLGIACGIGGGLLSIFTEWRFAPFVADGSLSYFLIHLTDLRPMTLVMIVLGAVFAFWFGLGRNRPTSAAPVQEVR